MSIRTFIFCDICNPQGIRSIESRRSTRLNQPGRRISDGRAWLECSIPEAIVEHSWIHYEDGRDICPTCQDLHLVKN